VPRLNPDRQAGSCKVKTSYAKSMALWQGGRKIIGPLHFVRKFFVVVKILFKNAIKMEPRTPLWHNLGAKLKPSASSIIFSVKNLQLSVKV